MLLVTAEEMRDLDRRTIESGHASGEQLMERAGRGVVEAMERRHGSMLALRVLVLCGTGNNGGDGFVAARHLRARGAETHVALLGERTRVSGDARLHLERLEEKGVLVTEIGADEQLDRVIAERSFFDLALDAMLGTGARGAPRGLVAAGVARLERMRAAGTTVIAVDLPTGVDADDGSVAAEAVSAELTVTFGAPKRGHWLYPGRAHCGAVEVVDIGLLPPAANEAIGHVELATDAAMRKLVPRRDPRAHKGAVGRVLVIGGSRGLTGAVALAARAASRAGAGYVQAAVPAALEQVFAIQLLEQMTIACGAPDRATLAETDWPGLRVTAERVDVIALGSGLSRAPAAAELARVVVRESARPLVLDADGLNAFEGRADELVRGGGSRVLTPHLGEMARLTGQAVAALEARRIDAAREWAARWQSVVVLKGAPTVTAAPDGRATVNATGNPGMATAGMGDVLTGVIAALIGQGLAPYDAARLGVYAHGWAGDRVADERGAIGMVASDVLEQIPAALHTLSTPAPR